VASSGAAIVAVARALRQLHEIAPPPGLRRVDFPGQSRQLCRTLPAGSVDAGLAQAAEDICARLQAAAPAAVLCHNDVHAQNLLFDRAGRLWLLDWEYAGLGDPMLDLASYASQQQLGEGASLLLVREYVAAGGSATVARLSVARWVFDYVQMLWYRGLDAIGTAAAGHPQARARASRLEADLLARASGVLRCNNGKFGHND
jgi:aminoglycoside phosphotransferase (APT) family kinase protein